MAIVRSNLFGIPPAPDGQVEYIDKYTQFIISPHAAFIYFAQASASERRKFTFTTEKRGFGWTATKDHYIITKVNR